MQSILQIRSRLRIPLFGLLLLGLQNRHSPFSVHVSYCQDNSESGSGTDDFTRAKKRLVDKTQRFISSFDEQVKNMNVYESISTFVSSDTPVLLSYGFFMGYTCGFCVKKVRAAVVFGVNHTLFDVYLFVFQFLIALFHLWRIDSKSCRFYSRWSFHYNPAFVQP